MKTITVIIYLLGATTLIVHQFFPCATPDLGPYDVGYDCLSKRVYFIHEGICGASIAMMWLVYKFSKPAGLFKSFQLGMLGLTIGGFIDVLMLEANNWFTLGGFGLFLISMAYGMVKKKS